MQRRQKQPEINQSLSHLLELIFSKEDFDKRTFLTLTASLAQDPALMQPSCIIFALYNIFVREEMGEVVENCLKKVENVKQKSAGNVAGLVIRSSLQAYNKKYKESLETLSQAYDIGKSFDVDKQNAQFYHQVVAQIIQIHDISTFRREYLQLIQVILDTYADATPQPHFIKGLIVRKDQLKDKLCLAKPRSRIENHGSTKLSFKKLEENPYIEQKKERSRSINSRSSQQSMTSKDVVMKRKFKKYQYVNPYDFRENKSEMCAFM